jgi:hypothetical protein
MKHSEGHGYDNPTMGDRKPCTAFDGLTAIANPLGGFSEADRERRVFHPENGGTGTTYGSHSLQLGMRTPEEGSPPRRRDTLFLMMSHGGGREVYSMRNGVYHHPIDELLTAMPERDLYSLLYSIWEAQQATYRQAVAETDSKWRRALAEKRVTKRRAKGGRAAHFDILSPWEVNRRDRKGN